VVNCNALQHSSPTERFAVEIQSAFDSCTVGEIVNVTGVHETLIFTGNARCSLAYCVHSTANKYVILTRTVTVIILNRLRNNYYYYYY